MNRLNQLIEEQGISPGEVAQWLARYYHRLSPADLDLLAEALYPGTPRANARPRISALRGPQPRQIRQDVDLVHEAHTNLQHATGLRDSLFDSEQRLLDPETARDAAALLRTIDSIIGTAAKRWQELHTLATLMSIEKAVKESFDEMGPTAARQYLDHLRPRLEELPA